MNSEELRGAAEVLKIMRGQTAALERELDSAIKAVSGGITSADDEDAFTDSIEEIGSKRAELLNMTEELFSAAGIQLP